MRISDWSSDVCSSDLETIAKFSNFLTENGAEIIHNDNWGLKKLAYPIEKKTTGFYHLIEFKAPGEIISKLEIEYKRDERVMRFLTIRLDKHALAYNEKKRSGAFNRSEEHTSELQSLMRNSSAVVCLKKKNKKN